MGEVEVVEGVFEVEGGGRVVTVALARQADDPLAETRADGALSVVTPEGRIPIRGPVEVTVGRIEVSGFRPPPNALRVKRGLGHVARRLRHGDRVRATGLLESTSVPEPGYREPGLAARMRPGDTGRVTIVSVAARCRFPSFRSVLASTTIVGALIGGMVAIMVGLTTWAPPAAIDFETRRPGRTFIDCGPVDCGPAHEYREPSVTRTPSPQDPAADLDEVDLSSGCLCERRSRSWECCRAQEFWDLVDL